MVKDKRGKQGVTEAERDEAIEFMAKTAGEAERFVGIPCDILNADKPKRGKDIKVFADLPPDVQEVIHKLSTIDGKIDQTDKAKRTAAAIKYQHLFPDRYHGTGPWALEDTGVA